MNPSCAKNCSVSSAGETMTEFWPPRSHFLDSGAFSLWQKSKATASSYKTYMDEYAAFIHANEIAIDYYANVDVMFDAKLSWDHQQYLEKEHGLSPVPVIHLGTDLQWIRHYINRGYRYIGLGGIAASTTRRTSKEWIRLVFDQLCNSRGIPQVKVHGFGIGGHRSMAQFPWHSVDTVRWAHLGSRGYLVLPLTKKGVWTAEKDAIIIKVGNTKQSNQGHLDTLPPLHRRAVLRWLDHLGFSAGDLANPRVWYACYLKYYEWLRKQLQKLQPDGSYKPLKIYYSGAGAKGGQPETVLKTKARIMLSFFDIPCPRFDRLLLARLSGASVSF